MKSSLGIRSWRPVIGLFGIGMLAFGVTLQLEGAPVSKPDRTRDVRQVSGGLTDAGAAVVATPPQQQFPSEINVPTPDSEFAEIARFQAPFIKAGTLPPGDLPILPPKIVDWRNDEATKLREAGLLVGPMPMAKNVTAGGCTHNIECEDGIKCTNDECDIDPANGPGSGTCTHNPIPAGESGDCDDGLFCNGTSTCENLVCHGGPNNNQPCTTNAFCGGSNLCYGSCAPGVSAGCCSATEFCSEAVARCSAESQQPNKRCASHADCPNGECIHCFDKCESNAECSDGKKCNGNETCTGSAGNPGICLAANNPCGAGADCSEGQCYGTCVGGSDAGLPCLPAATEDPFHCAGTNGTTIFCRPGGQLGAGCEQSADCPDGQCIASASPICFLGRCCSPFAPNDPEQPLGECLLGRLNTGPGHCAGQSGYFFAGDNGRQIPGELCGGANPLSPGDPLECPKYSSGIQQLASGGSPPVYTVSVGPISESAVPVALPNGPGGSGPLQKLGDDYEFLADGPFDALELQAMRWVGGMQVLDRVSFEFYDDQGNFIEDIFESYTDEVIGVQQLYFRPTIQIPRKGTVVLRVARNFSPNAKIRWAATSSAPAPGTNDSTKLWINDGDGDNDNVYEGLATSFLPAGNVMAFELVGNKSVATRGACCKTVGTLGSTTSTCSDNVLRWVCSSQGGEFLGGGSLCATCATGAQATQDCTRCVGDGSACDSDADCQGGGEGGSCVPTQSVCGLSCSEDGTPCTPFGSLCGTSGTCGNAVCGSNAECGVGACCVAGDCDVSTDSACAGTFRGYGTNCDINCCEQASTSADECGDATVIQITVPPIGQSKVIAISGDTSNATGPDGCFGDVDTIEDDPGWWQAFEILAPDGNPNTPTCAMVRMDFCCSETTFPSYTHLYPDCSCSQIISRKPNPYVYGQSDYNRGDPYCTADDNIWFTHGPLRQGNYYFPVLASLDVPVGPYQMHITVEQCPESVCCVGGTCDVDLKNQLECDDLDGFLLAPPQTGELANPICNPDLTTGTCATGSCCLGPGTCSDLVLGNPYTLATCTSDGGNFIGGVKCTGGICTAGTNIGQSCTFSSECGVGGVCNSTAQESPCPACEIEGNANCQLWDNQGTAWAFSDIGLGSGLIAADDFKPTGDTINKVCWWGFYLVGDANDEVAANDCGDQASAEKVFRVRIYEDDNNRPGTLIATRTRPTKRAEEPTAVTNSLFSPPVKTYGFQMDLLEDTAEVDPDPITGLTPGGCYWLEVATDSSDIVVQSGTSAICYWNWKYTGATNPKGNNWSYTKSESAGYQAGGEADRELTWCLSTDIDEAGCQEEINRACCSCGFDCDEMTLRECLTASRAFYADEPSCGSFSCPAIQGDECADPIETPIGVYNFNTRCATTSSNGQPMLTDFNQSPGDTMGADIWLKFEPVQDCLLRADMCPTGTAFDSMIGVYDGGTSCTCPGTASCSSGPCYCLMPPPEGGPCQGGDEDCTGAASGAAAVLFRNVFAGRCYWIRVGTWGPTGGPPGGPATVDISCGPPACGDGRKNGLEECDIGDDASCPAGAGSCTPCPGGALSCAIGAGGSPGACECGPAPVCGNNDQEGNEECDGTDSPNCPGQCKPPTDPPSERCTCATTCGNNVKELGEGCDGTDSDLCPGRCLGTCQCPATICGDGVVQLADDEECDPAAGSDPSQRCAASLCSEDGDPEGACRCTCGAATANYCGNGIKEGAEACDGSDAHCGDPDVFDCLGPGHPSGGCTCQQASVTPPSPNAGPADPDVPGDPPAGFAKNRFVSIVVPASVAAGGVPTAIRVRLVDLQNPNPPNAVCCPAPNFSSFEGQVRWVGSVGEYPESAENPGGPKFKAAVLQCSPHYSNTWDLQGTIHVTGAEIMPSGEYDIQAIFQGANTAVEGNYSTPELTLKTLRWGDVVPDFCLPGNCPTTQPDFVDISGVVDKFKSTAAAPIRARAQLQPQIPSLPDSVSFLDISACVDAFKGVAFPAIWGPITCP